MLVKRITWVHYNQPGCLNSTEEEGEKEIEREIVTPGSEHSAHRPSSPAHRKGARTQSLKGEGER